MSRGQYSDADVMQQMQREGGFQAGMEGGVPMDQSFQMGRSQQSMNMGPNPYASGASLGPGMTPVGMMTGNPAMMNQMVRGPQGVFATGYTEDFSRMGPQTMRTGPMMYDQMPNMPGETVISERIDAPQFLAQRVIGQEYIHGVKPYVTMEKVVEVPQTIVKETPRIVPKPEIVERIIQVPKIAYKERTVKALRSREPVYVERIIEVAKNPAVETRQQHVPKLDVQERLIEIPKIEFREKIEYEDRIEYREVPVDKIIEVPEIEYRIRDVERFVPQTYVQEYYVDRYTEVPVQQIQEVQREEYVPVVMPVPNYRAVGIPVPTPVQPIQVPVPVPVPTPMMGTMPGMPSMGQTMNMDMMNNTMPGMGMMNNTMSGMGSMMGPGMMNNTMPGTMMGPPGTMMNNTMPGMGSMMGPGMPSMMGPGTMMGSAPSFPGMPPGTQAGSMNMMNTVPGMGMPRTGSIGGAYANYNPVFA